MTVCLLVRARWVALAAMLAAVAFNDSWLRGITPRWLVFLGDISFSVYLIHVVTKDRLSKAFTDEGIVFFVGNVLLALLLGWLSYRYIESVGQKIARKRADRKMVRADGLA